MNKNTPNHLPEHTTGQRIRKLRLKAGLTQEQLSERLGFTANYFGQVERDAVPLSKKLADALCHYFHVTYDYLYCWSAPRNTCPEHGGIGPNQALAASLIQNCSEEECRLLEPIIRASVRALRDVSCHQHQNFSKNHIPFP